MRVMTPESQKQLGEYFHQLKAGFMVSYFLIGILWSNSMMIPVLRTFYDYRVLSYHLSNKQRKRIFFGTLEAIAGARGYCFKKLKPVIS